MNSLSLPLPPQAESLNRCMSRKDWSLPFQAEPAEVGGIRRVLRLTLMLWGLHHVVDVAQLCATELITNVIQHVGAGSEAELRCSMRGARLRLELRDTEAGELPTLAQARSDAETGRGLKLVDTMAADWGVMPHPGGKITWVELDTGLPGPHGHIGGDRITMAEELLIYLQQDAGALDAESVLSTNAAQETALTLIADLLHWLYAHGYDPVAALDRAQTCFEQERVPT